MGSQVNPNLVQHIPVSLNNSHRGMVFELVRSVAYQYRRRWNGIIIRSCTLNVIDRTDYIPYAVHDVLKCSAFDVECTAFGIVCLHNSSTLEGCACMCIYIYIYICIYREGEIEREREKDRDACYIYIYIYHVYIYIYIYVVHVRVLCPIIISQRNGLTGWLHWCLRAKTTKCKLYFWKHA